MEAKNPASPNMPISEYQKGLLEHFQYPEGIVWWDEDFRVVCLLQNSRWLLCYSSYCMDTEILF